MIDNLVLQGLCLLTARQAKVMMYVLRFTTGYHREEVKTSYASVAEWCGIDKSDVRKTIKHLQSEGLIYIEATRPTLYIRIKPLELRSYFFIRLKKPDDEAAPAR